VISDDDAESLDRLARRLGIERRFRDYFGREIVVSRATVETLTRAAWIAEEPSLLDPVLVVPENVATIVVPLNGELAAPALDWRLTLEDGTLIQGRSPVVGGAIRIEHRLPLGYHTLAARDATMALIVVPLTAWLPPELESGPGTWGFALQLYSLRSRRDWGIGDFGALRSFAAQACESGARTIGINPLHAPNLADPQAHSPYDPASRLWLNPLYIDVEAVEDFSESPQAQHAAQSVRPPDAAALVDYGCVANAKLQILTLCFDSFLERHRDDARGRAFQSFVERGGTALRDYATFCALAEHIRATTGIQGGWSTWPPGYRDRAGAAVAAFEREAAQRIAFYCYLQWIADTQLRSAAEATARGGIGLYRDLAVGTGADGADSWAAPEVFVRGVSIGAPPDPLNAAGQNWGLTPFNPAVLRRKAYAPFVSLLRANMRHAGALRIDHVMAMQRLFWIPHGRPAGEGTYVRYPLDDLLGIIALESTRQRCAVVGEDLGTVPDGFRERLAERRIFGCRLLFFEREPDGRFRPPAAYPPDALTSTGTHDMPSLPAWWTGADLELRERLGLSTPEAAHSARTDRERGRVRLIEALRTWGDLPDEVTLEALVESAYRFLARSPARLLIVQLEDVLLQSAPVNVPGTRDEYPNWRPRLPIDAEGIMQTPLAQRLAAILRGLRAPP